MDEEHLAIKLTHPPYSDGVLSDKTGMLLVKPCKQAEIDFYQTTADHPEFRDYIPLFYGELSLNQEASDTATSSSLISGPTLATTTTTGPQTHKSKASLSIPALADGPPKVAIPVVQQQPWVPSNGGSIVADSGIVLENVAHGFRRPNILDVKLGMRLWADDAPAPKRAKLDKVAAETTSSSLGFRIAGMKTWVGTNAGAVGKQYEGTNGYRKYDKGYGRKLDDKSVLKAFEDYFVVESAGLTRALTRRIVRRFLADLRDLKGVLEREEGRMYSASLLFVYEGDGEALMDSFRREKEMFSATGKAKDLEPEGESAGPSDQYLDGEIDGCAGADATLPKIQTLKVIDFAHAAWTPGQGPDENMLRGIRSVIKILEGLLE